MTLKKGGFLLLRKVNSHSHPCMWHGRPLAFGGTQGKHRHGASTRKIRTYFNLVNVCSVGSFQRQGIEPFPAPLEIIVSPPGGLPLWLQHILQVRFPYPRNVSLILDVRGRVCGGRKYSPCEALLTPAIPPLCSHSFYVWFSQRDQGGKGKAKLLREHQQQKILKSC